MKKLTLTLFVQLLAIAVWAQYEMVDAQFSILEQALEMAQAQKPSKELLETRGETFIRIATRGENWENEEWVATDSSSFSFDAELLEIGGHSFRSENAQWENYQLFTQTYENGLLMETHTQSWDGNGWVNDNQAFYTYENDLLSVYYVETWNGTAWVNSFRIHYDYNAEGLAALITFETGNGSDWAPWFTAANTFNAQGLTIQTVNQVYNTQNGQFENNNMQTFTYNADGNLTEQYLFLWVNDNWILAYRFVFELNAEGFRLKRIRQLYDSILDAYTVDFQDLYEYDADQNLVLFTNQDWTNETWVNDRREHYFYELILTNTEYQTTTANALLFPNPASDLVELTLGPLEISAVDLEIYTVDGRLVTHMRDLEYHPGQPIRLAVESWPAGTYHIRAHTPEGTFTQLLIRQ